MRILIIANFCRGQKGTLEDREVYLAELMTTQGHDVTLITSDFSHLTKDHRTLESEPHSFKSQIVLCHEPGYIKHAGLKRLWSHRIWGKNVLKYVKSLGEKPDMIYCAIPSLTAPVMISKYCRKNFIKFVVDVQDLWPEATFMVLKNKLLRKAGAVMSAYVNKAYSAADAIVGVSDTYVHRALSANKKNCKFLTVYLGNDGEGFDVAQNNNLESRGVNEFRLCYIGTLSYSYDLKCVIDALAILNKPEVKFIVCGDGPKRREFETYAAKKKVNCDFRGSLPYPKMVGVMCSCDAVVNCIVADAAQSITNKVGDYALSGLPVISTQECQEYRDLVEKYNCGINCRVGNADDVANAIELLMNDKNLCKIMGLNARRLGEERFDRRQSYQNIINLLHSLV